MLAITRGLQLNSGQVCNGSYNWSDEAFCDGFSSLILFHFHHHFLFYHCWILFEIHQANPPLLLKVFPKILYQVLTLGPKTFYLKHFHRPPCLSQSAWRCSHTLHCPGTRWSTSRAKPCTAGSPEASSRCPSKAGSFPYSHFLFQRSHNAAMCTPAVPKPPA